MVDQPQLLPEATPPGTYRQRGTSSLQRLFRAHFAELTARYEAEFAKRLGTFRLERITKAVDRFIACGTPWAGDAGMALNQCAPLAAVFVLAQSSRDRIEKLATSQALDAVLQTASIPWYDSGLLPGALRVCDRVVSGVPFFRLSFRPTPKVAGLVAAHIKHL